MITTSKSQTQVHITPKSLALFIMFADDAGNWSGTPLVSLTAAQRGNLVQLKKAGLVRTFESDDQTWLAFTALGYELACDQSEDFKRCYANWPEGLNSFSEANMPEPFAPVGPGPIEEPAPSETASADNPSCPKCSQYNAMLPKKLLEDQSYVVECRNCGFQSVVQPNADATESTLISPAEGVLIEATVVSPGGEEHQRNDECRSVGCTVLGDPNTQVVTADWKDAEDLLEGFRKALTALGISIIDHPDCAGSDTIGFILSNRPLTSEEIAAQSYGATGDPAFKGRNQDFSTNDNPIGNPDGI